MISAIQDAATRTMVEPGGSAGSIREVCLVSWRAGIPMSRPESRLRWWGRSYRIEAEESPSSPLDAAEPARIRYLHLRATD